MDLPDIDLQLLLGLWSLVDSQIKQVTIRAEDCVDPDSLGLFDKCEHLAGIGFVAAQQYLSAICGQAGVSKKVGLSLGHVHAGGETVANVINATANYWKHRDEWDAKSALAYDKGGLSRVGQRTVGVIETVTPWSDYMCSNVLSELSGSYPSQFEHVVPALVDWQLKCKMHGQSASSSR